MRLQENKKSCCFFHYDMWTSSRCKERSYKVKYHDGLFKERILEYNVLIQNL